jgi:ABC-type nitrate/sulfonate/bicarbonate transport system substrate-binding protein
MAKFIALFAAFAGGLIADVGYTASLPSRVIIAHGALNARIAPLWIAHEQKFFAKYGADSQIILVRHIQVTIAGLGTGEIHVALTGGSTLMGAAAGGLDVKLVAALNSRVGYDLVTAPTIKSPKDLRGKRFGIQAFGGSLWMGATLGLEHLGLDPQRDAINVLQVGDQTVLAQALETGRIDATALDGVFSRRLKQKGFTILAELSQANIPFIGLGLGARNSFIRERPELVEATLKGVIEAMAFILSPKNKSVVLKTIMTHLRILDPAVAEEGYQDLLAGAEKKPFPSLEGMRNIQRLLKIGNPKLENLKVDELIDDRILRKLDENGFIGRLYNSYGVK